MCRPPRLAGIGSKRSVLTKATSFAAIGVVNAAIDASVFFLVLAWLDSSVLAGAAFERIARPGGSAVVTAMQLALANTIAWLVAVSGSYAMNALATFAAESGGRLRWRDYGSFVLAGGAGLVVGTVVLLLAAQATPVWAAKGLAILAGFAVNFSLSLFIVFRPAAPSSRNHDERP